MESSISSTCGICNGDMDRGGVSGFTAECSHQFHSRCVSGSLRQVCPLCSARWRELPSFRSSRSKSTPKPPPAPAAQPFFRPMEPRVFDDDDPVLRPPRPPPPGDRRHVSPGATSSGSSAEAVALTTHCQYSALARDAAHDDFAVLLHARAPGSGGGARARSPLDLVTVLDVSGSMVGSKLALLKQAMGFVVDTLGPADRLCVVSFSSGAARLMQLARMSDGGKALAKRAVESLAAGGGTNIGAALRKAAKVLDDRLHRNAVASVILLSDGQDTYTVPKRGRDDDVNYEELVPPSFMDSTGERSSAPVHTFGFGTDHDAAAMHTVAEATGGTFSFIEEEADVQDAFAQCIGGLLSVAVQGLRVDVACAHADAGVRVRSVNSGRYRSHVDVDGRAASIDVGELYADEERRFLLLLDVPRARGATADDVTHLTKVTCAYRDVATGRAFTNVAGVDAAVLRPASRAVSGERSEEVERERVRLEATAGIAEARAAAERGAHAEAAEILRVRQRAVARSGDAMLAALSSELREMRVRVADRRRYELSGRAYVLAGLSSHAQQRATSRQVHSCDGERETMARHGLAEAGRGGTASSSYVRPAMSTASFSYVTPAMMDMLNRSRRSREMTARVQQQRSKERRKSANY